ncbi:MAG: DUF2029 domain-containing protein [Candidatus Schekmanbacteria bacterium]|nr:DUF2029 domain-containing protein [Candidatus Schekmanbacteria bacterium]
MKKKFIVFFGFTFLLSRIPFLNMGFGSDIDSWVYADTGFAIFKTGKYFASRGIGFPIYEFLLALLQKINETIGISDWLFTNGLSMITSIACLILFYKILTKWEVEHRELLLIAFTFMPVVWKNSINTMDYMLSLMFILFSQYLILQGKFPLSAIALGLAVGSRPTNGVMLLPLLYLIWKENKKEIPRFIIVFFITSFLFFIPFLYSYKLFSPEEYKNYMYPPSTFTMNLSKIGYRIFYEFIGIDAAIFLLILIPFSKEKLKVYFEAAKEKNKVVVFSTITILVFLALFIKYPFQPEYLIPLLPSAFILSGIFFKKRNLIILSLLVILNGFLIIPGVDFIFNSNGEVSIKPVPVSKGTLITDIEKRNNILEFRKLLPNLDFKEHSIVIWHEYQPVYVYFNRNEIFETGTYFNSKRHLICLDYVFDPKKDIYMTHLVPDELRGLLTDHNIYYIPCAVRVIRGKSNIELLKYNPILLSKLKSMDY